MVHAYCCKWRLKANVSKSAVVVFARELVEGSWNWGEQALPRLLMGRACKKGFAEWQEKD